MNKAAVLAGIGAVGFVLSVAVWRVTIQSTPTKRVGSALSSPPLSEPFREGLRANNVPHAVGADPQRTDRQRELDSQAEVVYQRIQANGLKEACPQVMDGIVGLVRGAPEHSALWQWGIERASECISFVRDPEVKKNILRWLLAADPKNHEFLTARALNEFQFGNFDLAAKELEGALAEEDFHEGWDLLGMARLKQAREFDVAKEADKRVASLMAAKYALLRSIELGGSPANPLTMSRLAEVEFGLGDTDAALAWADKAIQGARPGGSEINTFSAATVYFNVGIVYYRAGQRETGIAYMDQGINLTSDGERGFLLSLREQVIKGNI